MQSKSLVLLVCLLFQLSSKAVALTNGADVSWITQMESSGYSFYNSAGTKTDLFVLLKKIGLSAVRLRVFVNPSNGFCDGADTLYKAKRAKAQGLAIMIDFHYSDVWADPGHQTKPAAWSSHTILQLYNDVYDHTYGILNYLKSNGITVSWVQVGNEINGGMLWPQGSTSNFTALAGLINSGYNAVKAVYSNAKVIQHLANGYNNAVFRWFFDGVKSKGAKWDVIGMSHYPLAGNWSTYNTLINANMKDMVSRYGKPIVIAEVGMSWSDAATSKSMMADLVTKVKALGGNGIGIFYWEPQAYPGWQGYQLGAMDDSGKFTAALNAL